MFANQRRGSAGLGSITGVVLVALIWVIGATVMLKTYREGGASLLPSSCAAVCQSVSSAVKKG